MRQSDLKNIVVLKNLPSNIVEEAIVILKTNKTAKKVQKIEKRKGTKKEENSNKKEDYILKEAELLISNYVDNIENNKNECKNNHESSKYTRIKNYAYIVTFALIIESLIILIK